MRCFWEQIGVLEPIYRLVGRGLNDSDIAGKLGVTELSVQSCVAWIIHFLRLPREKSWFCMLQGWNYQNTEMTDGGWVPKSEQTRSNDGN